MNRELVDRVIVDLESARGACEFNGDYADADAISQVMLEIASMDVGIPMMAQVMNQLERCEPRQIPLFGGRFCRQTKKSR